MRNLELSSGIYRTTFRGRFREFDRTTIDILRGKFDAGAELRVEDWAASDCLTSAEWAASLLAEFPHAELAASDLMLFLLEVETGDGDAFVIEANGAPLQHLTGPFVIRMAPGEPRSLPLNWLLWRRATERFRSLRENLSIPEAWLESANEELDQPPLRIRKIPVTHPEALELARREPRFTVRKHSAFDALVRPVEVIRTMNIFNRSYFGAPRLSEGAEAVWKSLAPGGVWIVGRTVREDPPAHDASFLIRTPSGFETISRTGNGSEVEAIGLALRR
jgi:hypothetical protein